MVYLLPYFLESSQKRFIEVVAAFFVENASSLLTSYNAINSEYVRFANEIAEFVIECFWNSNLRGNVRFIILGSEDLVDFLQRKYFIALTIRSVTLHITLKCETYITGID